jgi:serine/threonine protein kinase
MDAPTQVKALFEQGLLRNIQSPKTGDLVRLDKFLGKGSFGAVFKGYYEKYKLDVAVKVILLQHQNSLKEFSQESAAYLEVSSQPLCGQNIVCMMDTYIVKLNYQGPEINLGIIISEFMNGGDLTKGLDDSQVPIFMYSMLNALDFLHNKGFAHRDIKPANILRSNVPDISSTFKLGDLGISCSTHFPGIIPPCKYYGTVLYLSPEGARAVINKTNHTTTMHQQHADDIWQLGLTFVQLIYGQFPTIPGGWIPQNVAKLDQQLLSQYINRKSVYPRQESPALSGTVIMNILSSMLRVNPEERSPARFLFRYLRQNIKIFDINFTNLGIYNYFLGLATYEITPDFERKTGKIVEYFKATKTYDPYYFLDKYTELKNEYTLTEQYLNDKEKTSRKLVISIMKNFAPLSDKIQY